MMLLMMIQHDRPIQHPKRHQQQASYKRYHLIQNTLHILDNMILSAMLLFLCEIHGWRKTFEIAKESTQQSIYGILDNMILSAMLLFLCEIHGWRKTFEIAKESTQQSIYGMYGLCACTIFFLWVSCGDPSTYVWGWYDLLPTQHS